LGYEGWCCKTKRHLKPQRARKTLGITWITAWLGWRRGETLNWSFHGDITAPHGFAFAYYVLTCSSVLFSFIGQSLADSSGSRLLKLLDTGLLDRCTACAIQEQNLKAARGFVRRIDVRAPMSKRLVSFLLPSSSSFFAAADGGTRKRKWRG